MDLQTFAYIFLFAVCSTVIPILLMQSGAPKRDQNGRMIDESAFNKSLSERFRNKRKAS